jgi:hypothetical protein
VSILFDEWTQEVSKKLLRPLVCHAQLAPSGKKGCFCLKLSQPCEGLFNVRPAVGVNALAVLVLANLEVAVLWLYRVFDAVVEDGIRFDAPVLSLY